MSVKKTPSANELKFRIKYNQLTGVCVWQNNKNRKDLNGKVIGKEDKEGYFRIEFNQKKYYLHRVIYKIMTDKDPEFIDHIDGNRSNNCWSNLRSVTVAENNKNKRADRRDKTGIHGVTWRENHQRWAAAISVNGNTKHLGSYDTLLDSCCARKKAEIEYGFHENHGR